MSLVIVNCTDIGPLMGGNRHLHRALCKKGVEVVLPVSGPMTIEPAVE